MRHTHLVRCSQLLGRYPSRSLRRRYRSNALGRMFVGLGSDLTFAYIDRTAWLTAAIALTGVVSLNQPTPSQFIARAITWAGHGVLMSCHAVSMDCVVLRSAGHGPWYHRRLLAAVSYRCNRWYEMQFSNVCVLLQ